MASGPSYLRPSRLDEALDLLSGEQHWRLLAGGTDHFPARVGPHEPESILDISAIDGLKGIRISDDRIRIGALTTWTEIRNAVLPPAFDGLKAAAAEVGGRQIQNRGTIAGNLCNASPAADGIPPLLTLNADIVLTGRGGERRMPLDAFLTGYRQTALAPGEILTEISVPTPTSRTIGGFRKLGARRYLVISIAMAAGIIVPDTDGTVAAAHLALGSCSAVAHRLPKLEAALIGRTVEVDPVDAIDHAHFEALTPIDDARASAAYRHDAARILTGRLLRDLFDDARKGLAT